MSLLELILTKILEDINEIFRHIKHINQLTKQSNKKTLLDKSSSKLLKLEFKSENMIKSNAAKYTVLRYYLIMSKLG